MKNNKKSPLTDKPLRNPGQSLDDEIDSLLNEDAATYIIASIFMTVLTGLEWWRWYNDLPYAPITYSVMTLIVATFSVYKIIKIKKKLKYLRQGRDGERAIGQYLEGLRETGCRVFHDIVGDGFNLDHVVISQHGVFVVETKTYSKPQKGEAKIVIAGEQVLINGSPCKSDVITQAKAEANWLKGVLRESSGKDIMVKPVVVFPGWYIDNTATSKSLNVWILNPKALPTYIENTPEVLTKEDMMLLSYHISRYIRTT